MNTHKLYGKDFANYRSQAGDNASNIGGIYSGIQARFREINNLAECVKCAAHSLNLVGSPTVECCLASMNDLDIVQSIYAFFSASPQRWLKFKQFMKNNTLVLQCAPNAFLQIIWRFA